MAVHEEAPEISKEEAELYDRQIRLWGLDAQRRLRAANVFLAGLKGEDDVLVRAKMLVRDFWVSFVKVKLLEIQVAFLSFQDWVAKWRKT